uniref:NADH-ubiquinone oxidoreductase chain 6 n=1 Tax=Scipinia horrida TaxID=1524604 RepID=A0A343W927_9HEMI|nr:NADH dehydrogenase subunit 6 [Scipinia horrida]AVZ00867.1 NADH dehydrogenase subunit 6 [Scipinia horrida]
MVKMWIIMSIMISLTFIFLKHPLSMGFALILQTITISMITGQLINNFWFSYILLITMLSGALVLFIYMASIASNEKFHTSIKMMMLLTLMLITMYLYMDNKLIKTAPMMETISLNNNQMISLTMLFNMNNMMITILIVSYLFLTMIAISYIVNVFEGPLRMKN